MLSYRVYQTKIPLSNKLTQQSITETRFDTFSDKLVQH